MRKSKALRRTAVLGLTAAALGLGALNAPFAAAETYWTADGEGSWVEYRSSGDQFWVHDSQADGYSAAVQYQFEDQKIVTLVNDRGVNTSKHFVRDFPEIGNIQFRACRHKTSTGKVSGCGKWVHADTSS
ncbi:hypothetical protein ACFYYR_16345 [Streptomyces sp. NPDC001922]|uniref:hypothetical protein n=1 Tax=Streptomyces sp. NPDC001922 TaxID=3364624 RepID=UPI00368A5F51